MAKQKFSFRSSSLYLCSLLAFLPAAASAADLIPDTYFATLNQNQPEVTQTVRLQLPAQQVAPVVDVYLLADTTGSMGSYLTAMQNDARELAENLFSGLGSQGADVRIGIGSYTDFYGPGNPVETPAFSHQLAPVGQDGIDDIESEIFQWFAAGGASTPEGQFFALDRLARNIDSAGSTIGWRSNATKIVVWFGDQPGHDPICSAMSGLDEDITEASVTAALVAANIRVIGVSSTAPTTIPGLDRDPRLGVFQYEGVCDIGGSPGQASRIAAATHGEHIPAATPSQIVELIEDAVIGVVSTHGTIELVADAALRPYTSNIVDTTVGGCADLPMDRAHECSFDVTFRADCESAQPSVSGRLEAVTDGNAIAHQDVDLDMSHACLVPPIAMCEAVEVRADEQCRGEGDIDDGSYDPDYEPGDSISIVQHPAGPYPLGDNAVALTITDDDGLSGTCEAFVTVVDESAPVMELVGDGIYTLCDATPGTIQLELPHVEDNCSSTELLAQIVGVNGQPARPTIDIEMPAGTVELTPGTYTIAWYATDEAGYTTNLFQTIQVVATGSAEDCCDLDGATVVDGTDGSDQIEHMLSTSDLAVSAGAADDVVTTGYGDDCILGGAGADNIASVAGHDVVWGGDSDDDIATCIWNQGGTLQASGGSGNDSISGQYCEHAEIRGGPGNDVLTGSFVGADHIWPGSGTDVVTALGGDDHVYLLHECEASPGKTLNGGAGHDTLHTPVSVSELASLGVTVTGFEAIVVDTSRAHLSDCR